MRLGFRHAKVVNMAKVLQSAEECGFAQNCVDKCKSILLIRNHEGIVIILNELEALKLYFD